MATFPKTMGGAHAGKAAMPTPAGLRNFGNGAANYALTFTTDPPTGTVGGVINFSGTVMPSGTPLFVGLSENPSIFIGGTFGGGIPVHASVTGTIWSLPITLTTDGTFYPVAEIPGSTTCAATPIVVTG